MIFGRRKKTAANKQDFPKMQTFKANIMNMVQMKPKLLEEGSKLQEYLFFGLEIDSCVGIISL